MQKIKRAGKAGKRFAEGTGVPASRSRGELVQLFVKHEVTQHTITTTPDGALVRFLFRGYPILFTLLNVPREAAKDPAGWGKWTEAKRAAWASKRLAQLEREAWRRLLLCVKAKLEMVRDGARTVEQEFLADIALFSGGTVLERLDLSPEALNRLETRGEMSLLPPGQVNGS